MRLHFTADDYYRRAIKAIEAAQEEVLLEVYIFDMDSIGLRFLAALEKAQARGVTVKLSVDGIGSFNWMHALQVRCAKSGLPFSVFHPLPLHSKFRFSWRVLRQMIRFFRAFNQRLHRKVLIVDRQKVFLGSANISQVHTREFMGAQAWRDTNVEIEFPKQDPDLELLREALLNTFSRPRVLRALYKHNRLKRRLKILHLPSQRIRLNAATWWRHRYQRDLLKRLRSARKKILITNAYFVPRRTLTFALRKAALRGVEVVLVLPQKTDVWFVRAASRSLFSKLIRDGVKIYEYRPSILHAKTIVIDDSWSTVGSHNLNSRSMLHDLEVSAAIWEPELVQQLTQQFALDVQKSALVTMAELKAASRWRRLISRIAYWFRYWL
jgi:cardiolipin synthase